MCSHKCHSTLGLRAAVAAAMIAATWGDVYSIAAGPLGTGKSTGIAGGGLAATSTLTWVGPATAPTAQVLD